MADPIDIKEIDHTEAILDMPDIDTLFREIDPPKEIPLIAEEEQTPLLDIQSLIEKTSKALEADMALLSPDELDDLMININCIKMQ